MSESQTMARPEDAGQGRKDESASAKFGVVLFDDEKAPTSAWASVNGGEAKRINSAAQLPTDTIWWSNLSYNSFQATELWRNPWLRYDGYLVVKQKDVLAEWGHDPATASPDYTAKFASMVFGRIMVMAYRLARECNPRLRMSDFFKGNTLRQDVRCMLPKADYPRAEAAMTMKSGQAFQEFTRTTVRGPRNGKLLMLRTPRLAYAHRMFQTPVPKGQFQFKDRFELRQIAPDRVRWLRSTNRPVMAEVTVQEMEQDVAPIYGFGNATDKAKRVPRSWVTHPELIVMSAFSDLEVKNAWVGAEYTLITNDLPDPVKKFLSDKFTETSWSAAVLSETLWRAAVLGQALSEVGQRPPPEERADTSWRGAWLKAADKVNMFNTAMRMSELGYAVTSYGYGWLAVSITEDQIHDVIHDALALGIMPKLHDIPGGMFDGTQAIPWGGDKKTMTYASLVMSKQTEILWNMDKLPLMDEAQRKVLLQRIIAESKRRGM